MVFDDFFGIRRNFQSISTTHNFSRFCIIHLLGIRHNFRPIFATRYHLCYLLIFFSLFCPIYWMFHIHNLSLIFINNLFLEAFFSPLAFEYSVQHLIFICSIICFTNLPPFPIFAYASSPFLRH